MAVVSTNMGLKQWNLGTDFFSYVDLSNNFAKIDTHDHTSGKGVQIPTEGLANSAVTQTKLASAAVGTAQLIDNSVTSAKIPSGAVGNSQLASGAVSLAKMGNDSVGLVQIVNGSIIPAKLAGSPSLSTGQTLVWNGSGFGGTSPSGNTLMGLAADRPAASIQGRVYYATDTGDMYIDSGTTWIQTGSTYYGKIGGGAFTGNNTWMPLGSVTSVGPTLATTATYSSVATGKLQFQKDGAYRVQFNIGGGAAVNGAWAIGLWVVEASNFEFAYYPIGVSGRSSSFSATLLSVSAGDSIALKATCVSGDTLAVSGGIVQRIGP